MKPTPNNLILQKVAEGLGNLIDQIVFVGGATTELYIDDPAAPPVTPSDDVDCVIEIAGAIEYRKLEAKLRKLGFKTPSEEENNKILCRWDYKGISVDVMPTDEKILGFSNRWYPEGIKNKISVGLPNKTEISIFTTPYFIASKMEALKDRAGNDLRFSQDFEDIVAVLDGRKKVESELKVAPAKVHEYLKSEFSKLLKKSELTEEAVQGFLHGSRESSARATRVIKIMRNLITT